MASEEGEWYFDGSSGCEKCGAYTGVYPFDPGRPHPNCNCKCSRILEECTLKSRDITEVPGDTWESEDGRGSTPNSVKVDVYQNFWVVIYEVWECIDYQTGNRYTNEIVDEWEDSRIIRSFERTEV